MYVIYINNICVFKYKNILKFKFAAEIVLLWKSSNQWLGVTSITNCRHSEGQIRGVNDVGYTCNQFSKAAIWLFTHNYTQTYLGSLSTLFRVKIEKLGGKNKHNVQSKIMKGYTEAVI